MITFDEIWSGDIVDVVCVGQNIHNCVSGEYRHMLVKDAGLYMMLELETGAYNESDIVYVNTKYIMSVHRHKRPVRKDEDEAGEEDAV